MTDHTLSIGPVGLDQLVFVFLIVFALFVVFARNLKHAIITSGVFGLWAGLAYLLYQAPDVAVSEAVIASSLGTILYVLAIRHYDDVTAPHVASVIGKRRAVDLLLVAACVITLIASSWVPHLDPGPLQTEVMARYFSGPQIVNPVTSILLNFRVVDTIFEALLLVVAVLGVIHLTDPQSRVGAKDYHWFNRTHPTMRLAVNLLIPFILIAGIALIVGDPYTPGGGFQGGGLLAAVVISRYLIRENDESGIKQMATLEKIVFLIFVASVVLYIVIGWRDAVPESYPPFMIAMNGLLGLKVFCGLSLMFLYFASERGESQHSASERADETRVVSAGSTSREGGESSREATLEEIR